MRSCRRRPWRPATRWCPPTTGPPRARRRAGAEGASVPWCSSGRSGRPSEIALGLEPQRGIDVAQAEAHEVEGALAAPHLLERRRGGAVVGRRPPALALEHVTEAIGRLADGALPARRVGARRRARRGRDVAREQETQTIVFFLIIRPPP